MEDPTVGSGAEALIEVLNAHGIDRIFLNPGIDLVPLMAVIARFKAIGRKVPGVVLCTDESVAVAAAHGYAMVTERPQLVAVFEDVGLLQGGGAIVNLQYGRIPVILCSGKNSSPNRSNWMGEPFDQRRIVRDYVKWDHGVEAGEDISSVIRNALEIAAEEPCGPVYVTFPRDVMTGRKGRVAVPRPVGLKERGSLKDDAEALDRAARMLLSAENPLVMTAYAGRHIESVSPLLRLAETLGARVVTTDLRMSFPSTHPLCPGIDCIKGDSYDHYFAEADVLLLVDYDFPGPIGKRLEPRQDAKIIHFDVEPLKHGSPLWNRHPDVLVEGDSRRLLPALLDEVRRLLTSDLESRIRARFDRLENEHRRVKEDWRGIATRDAQARPISPEWLCYCINETLDDEAILVHRIPSHADALSHQLRRTNPGTMFSWGDSAGSMGWPLPAALGAKLAAPEKLVVSLLGDGGFIYGCPTATLWGAAAYNAPFLTIIFNNGAYGVFREVMGMFYGTDMEKAVSGNLGFEVGIDIRNPPDFAAIARACNAYGETIDDPSEIPAGLKRAVQQVWAGKSAVLDVRLAPRRQEGDVTMRISTQGRKECSTMGTHTPTRTEAFDLLKEYNTNPSLIRHALAVESVMAHFAAVVGEPDGEKWAVIGLIHDVDYERYPESHCKKAREILARRDWPEEYIHAVESHGWGICTDVEPHDRMEKVLYTVDELTGLIAATALLRPSKSVLDLTPQSVKKKWKQKGFAAGVSREIIEAGAKSLGMELDVVIAETIKGMQKVARDIGLEGDVEASSH